MREFIVIGTRTVTSQFNINDMAGSAGRMDVMARAVTAALMFSNGMRRDVRLHLVLLGPTEAPKTITLDGSALRGMGPDERSVGGFLNRALEKILITEGAEYETSPGIKVRRAGPEDVLAGLERERLVYLHEDGEPLDMALQPVDPVYVIGDDLGLRGELDDLVTSKCPKKVNLGPVSYQTDQCIVVLNRELDNAGR